MIIWYADEVQKDQIVVGQINVLMNGFDQTSTTEAAMDVNMLDVTNANSVVASLNMKVQL